MQKRASNRKLAYNNSPLKAKAGELEKLRQVSKFCRDLDISRTHFYDVVNGASASYPMLMKVGRAMGFNRDDLLPTEAEEVVTSNTEKNLA